MLGKLIVFEGCEGSGKTTQLDLTRIWLQQLELPLSVVITREPGGTLMGQDVRRLVLSNTNIRDRTELLLYAADRTQHIKEIIKPNLEQGKLVLCDRFTYSTLAYQGYGRGLDLNLIHQLNEIATDGLKPDLTIFLDIEPERGLDRTRPEDKDRIEKEHLSFHLKVQQGYLNLVKTCPEMVRIDANRHLSVIHQDIQAVIKARILKHLIN